MVALGPPTTHSWHAADGNRCPTTNAGQMGVFEPFTSRCRLDHCRVKSLYAPGRDHHLAPGRSQARRAMQALEMCDETVKASASPKS